MLSLTQTLLSLTGRHQSVVRTKVRAHYQGGQCRGGPSRTVKCCQGWQHEPTWMYLWRVREGPPRRWPRHKADARQSTINQSAQSQHQARSATLHRLEEIVVCLGVLQLIQQELNGRSVIVHGVQKLTQNPDPLNVRLGHQKIFTTGTGTADINRRIHPLLRNLAVQV